MIESRILWIRHGSMVKTLQDFLAAWWRQVKLDAMIAPVTSNGGFDVSPQIIEDPTYLTNMNPFAPVMFTNAASLVEEFIGEHPEARLATILRPCELRTLIELQKREGGDVYSGAPSKRWEKNIITVGVDCMGTLPFREYARRVKAVGAKELTREATFSSIPIASLRTACQFCDVLVPQGADFTIGVLGTAPAHAMLISAPDKATLSALCLHVQGMNEKRATQAELICRARAIGEVAENRMSWRDRLRADGYLGDGDLSNLMACVARCTLCADCLDACPFYKGELADLLGVGGGRERERPPLSELVDVSRWLASCTGCGMCEEACSRGVPLMMLIFTISDRIREELHYRPGDPEQRLPWGLER